MAVTEKQLRQIFNSYILLSSCNKQQAIMQLKEMCIEILESYKKHNNDNSNKT